MRPGNASYDWFIDLIGMLRCVTCFTAVMLAITGNWSDGENQASFATVNKTN